MEKYSLNENELVEHLKDQIIFLVNSSISYDSEFEGEAKRLAEAIRILVNNTSKSSALLTQLNKMDILFYDTATPFKLDNRLSSNCLAMIRYSKKIDENMDGCYVAPIDFLSPSRNPNKRVGFERWWSRNTIMKDIKGNTFTRKDLILNVADKEGGAHVDPKLDGDYANLTKFNSLGWKVHNKSEIQDFDNPVPASIRQIAHEIIKSLKTGVLDLFSDKDSVLGKIDAYEKHCLERSKQLGFIKEVT